MTKSHAKAKSSKVPSKRKTSTPEPEITQSPKSIPRRLIGPVISLLVITALSMWLLWGQYPWIYSLSAGVLVSLILIGIASLYKYLTPRLGTLTAIAGTSLACGVVAISLALLSPSCPGSLTDSRCTLNESYALAVFGMLLPLLVVLVVGVPAFLFKYTRLSVKWSVSRIKEIRTKS